MSTEASPTEGFTLLMLVITETPIVGKRTTMRVRASSWVKLEDVVRQIRSFLLQNPTFYRVASDEYLERLGSRISPSLVIIFCK